MSDTTPTTGGELVDKFITNVPTEVKRYSWEIKDFLAILALDHLPNPSVEFEAGQSIFGQRTKWRMTFTKSPVLAVSLALLTDPGSDFGNVFAKYDISMMTSADRRILCNTKPALVNITKFLTTSNNNNKCHVIFELENIKLCLVKDDLTVNLKLALYGQKFVNSEVVQPLCKKRKRKMVEQSQTEALNSFGSLLTTGMNSDFVIKVKLDSGDDFAEIKVHKNILGSRSEFFQAMFDSGMKEEGAGCMTIEDLSLECVNLTLKWIYTGSLEDDWKKVPEEMVRAADKYRLTLLLDWLDKSLHQACDLENAMILVKVAKLHGLTTATKNVTEFVKTNLEKIL